MPDYRVSRIGTDPNGRPLLMTTYMRLWWADVCEDLGYTPTITQGAFMARAGGGAAASAGYHDLAGCLDLRVWDQSAARVEQIIRTLRRHGAAAWLRDAKHGGMDPHIHLVLGSDHPLTSGAASQWRAYVVGRDGLASNGPDYHWRPRPLVLEPPKEIDDMFSDEDRQALRDLAADQKKRADRTLAFQKYVRQALGSAKGVDKKVLAKLDQLLADDA